MAEGLKEKIENTLYFCLGRLVRIVLEPEFIINVDKNNHIVNIKELKEGYDCNSVLLGLLEDYDNSNKNDPILSFWGDAKFFDVQGGCFYRIKLSAIKEYELVT